MACRRASRTASPDAAARSKAGAAGHAPVPACNAVHRCRCIGRLGASGTHIVRSTAGAARPAAAPAPASARSLPRQPPPAAAAPAAAVLLKPACCLTLCQRHQRPAGPAPSAAVLQWSPGALQRCCHCRRCSYLRCCGRWRHRHRGRGPVCRLERTGASAAPPPCHPGPTAGAAPQALPAAGPGPTQVGQGRRKRAMQGGRSPERLGERT